MKYLHKWIIYISKSFIITVSTTIIISNQLFKNFINNLSIIGKVNKKFDESC